MAYLNFQNCTRQEYENVLYSQDAKHKIKILFNNIELQNADLYCEKFEVKPRIIQNGSKTFSLNAFVSKEAELILHDIDTSIIQNQVSISIGTLVNNTYEYVPIGIFNIENQPTTDKDKTTITLRDNSVKFDFNYNAQTLIEANNGSATKLQILQDICTQAGVTCNITSFVGYLDEIGVYDSTITARQYIANIAEQAGKIATINRSGELIFVDLNNLTTWEIPIGIVEKYENGTSFKIGRVVYEDGIVRYETEDSNDDTLFLDGSNNYINGELVKEQESSNNNSYTLQNTGEANLAYFELEGNTTQETTTGANLVDIGALTPNADVTYTWQNDTLVVSNSSGTYKMASAEITDLVKNNPGKILKVDYASKTFVGTAMVTMQITNNGSNSWPTLVTSSGEATYTIPNDTSGITLARLRFMSNNSSISQAGSLTLVKPMVHFGSSSMTYEKYTGAIASPNPNYPQKIVSVGYENLFDYENTNNYRQITGAYSTLTKINNGIRATITQAGNYRYGVYVIDNIGDMKGKTYTIKVTITPSASNNGRIRIYGWTGTAINTEITNTNGTFTVPSNFAYNQLAILLYANSNGTSSVGDYVDYTNIQLEMGNATHSYIPYGKYGIEITTMNKNIGTLINGYLNNSGGFVIDNNVTSFSFPVKSGETYIYTSTGNRTLGAIFPYKPTVATDCISGTFNSSLSKNTPFTAQADGIMVIYTNSTYSESVANSFQIEKGSTVTTYEAHKENTNTYVLDEPLRGIGNYKDLLYIKNGMLYVERKIGKVVLNGSENWGGNKSQGYYTQDNNMARLNDYTNAIKSNYFLPTINHTFNYNASASNDLKITGYNKSTSYEGQNWIYINYYQMANASALKTWLSTHNTEVNYVLENSYTEELGEIDTPQTYNNTTYIDIYSNINTNSYVQYRKNKTQLEAILQETNQFDINSFKTGKILGNPAIDGYDLIQITNNGETYKTLATTDLIYNGVITSTYDTQIGKEAKEQNVFINGEASFKKWAKTQIDNVEGTISLQAGLINDLTEDISTTKVEVGNNGVEISTVKSYFDNDGNAKGVKTTENKYTFDDEGLKIQKSDTDYNTLIDNTGTYYKDGDTIISSTTKDGFLAKDFRLQGQHYYSYNGNNSLEPLASENYDFVDERIEIEINGMTENAYATFYNGEV